MKNSFCRNVSTGRVVFVVNLTQVTEGEKLDVISEGRPFLYGGGGGEEENKERKKGEGRGRWKVRRTLKHSLQQLCRKHTASPGML